MKSPRNISDLTAIRELLSGNEPITYIERKGGELTIQFMDAFDPSDGRASRVDSNPCPRPAFFRALERRYDVGCPRTAEKIEKRILGAFAPR